MHHIGNQVIDGGSVSVLLFRFFGQKVPEIDSLDGKIDYRGILFYEKRVLRKPLDIQEDEGRQPSELKLEDNVVFVRLVLLFGFTVEFA